VDKQEEDLYFPSRDRLKSKCIPALPRRKMCVLRALQQINSATRIEGEAAMSAPPFFQLARRGDLLFFFTREGPTVVIWESLSEQEKESWLEESSTMHDWVVWCK